MKEDILILQAAIETLKQKETLHWTQTKLLHRRLKSLESRITMLENKK